MTMLSEDERQWAIVYIHGLEEMVRHARERLRKSREEWAAEAQPSFGEWREYVGDSAEGGGTGEMMEWARQTGRKARPW